jgi:hypothetical protein
LAKFDQFVLKAVEEWEQAKVAGSPASLELMRQNEELRQEIARLNFEVGASSY